MIYFQVTNSVGREIASNIRSHPQASELLKLSNSQRNFVNHLPIKQRSAFETVGGTDIWVIAYGEEDLVNSTRVFKKTFEIYKNVADSFSNILRDELDNYTHTLKNVRAQMKQKMDGVFREDEFIADSYGDLIFKVTETARNKPEIIADLVCYLQKRITDFGAHMTGVQVVNSELIPEKFVEVSLKRAILNLYAPFEKSLTEIGVNLKINFDESVKIFVDKELFSLVMYNFFDNAVKYIKPGSDIRIIYSEESKNIDFSMSSLKMERDEIKELFKRGGRGRHAVGVVKGNGIGLYAIKKVLNSMGMDIHIFPNYQNNQNFDGKEYIENHFKIQLSA